MAFCVYVASPYHTIVTHPPFVCPLGRGKNFPPSPLSQSVCLFCGRPYFQSAIKGIFMPTAAAASNGRMSE